MNEENIYFQTPYYYKGEPVYYYTFEFSLLGKVIKTQKEFDEMSKEEKERTANGYWNIKRRFATKEEYEEYLAEKEEEKQNG